MKADLAFCGCMILWAVGFIGAELGVTPSDLKELVPTMTPTTITILAVAAYFAVGYGASIYVYAKDPWPTWRPYVPALVALVGWYPWLLWSGITRPHRYFAALVKKLNAPAPVQMSGAFAGGGKASIVREKLLADECRHDFLVMSNMDGRVVEMCPKCSSERHYAV
jgi:hypothetical protein